MPENQGRHASLIVADFSPLRVGREWRAAVAAAAAVPVHEVDAHNVVPAWEVSDKQEYAARTIRPKINRRLDEFLTEFPPTPAAPFPWSAAGLPPPQPVNWKGLIDDAR